MGKDPRSLALEPGLGIRSTQMRKLLISALCGLMALPTVSLADDHRPPPPPPGYRYGGGHSPPPAYYRPPPGHYAGYRYYPYRGVYAYSPYPYYGYKQHHHDNDDALWAIGGLIVGAVLATAVQDAAAPPPAPASASAPAPVAENCYDDIIHDAAGTPHVERNCYPATAP
jgi:hypothetical protein